MPLKAVLDALDDPELDKPAREFFKKRDDGRFALDAEPPPALEHERRQRAEAVKAREDAIRARDEAATKLTAAEAKLAEAEKAGQRSPGAEDDFKAQLAEHKRVYDQGTAELRKLIDAEKAKREAAEKTVRETKLVDMLRMAAKEVGVADDAEVDFMNRAKPLYRENTETGEWEPYENGQPLYGFEDTTRLRTPVEVAREITKKAKHLLPSSSGSGASGGNGARINGTIIATREQMRDAKAYAEITERAEKTGAQIQVSD